MPVYECCCGKCNELFSLYQSVSSAGKDIKCPKCGSGDMHKKISAFSVCSAGGASASSCGSSAGSGGGY